MTPSGTLPQVVSLLRGHVSRKYFHISSREWATIIKLEKLIILIKRRSRGFPEQVFSLLSNWVISRNSFLYDNQSKSDSSYNYRRGVLELYRATCHQIDPPPTFFYYLLKLTELQWPRNSRIIKISFSIQKAKNKLSASK